MLWLCNWQCQTLRCVAFWSSFLVRCLHDDLPATLVSSVVQNSGWTAFFIGLFFVLEMIIQVLWTWRFTIVTMCITCSQAALLHASRCSWFFSSFLQIIHPTEFFKNTHALLWVVSIDRLQFISHNVVYIEVCKRTWQSAVWRELYLHSQKILLPFLYAN